MDDELKRRFQYLSQRAPDGQPAVRDVTRQGRRRKAKRSAATACAVVVMLAASGIGVRAVMELSGNDDADVLDVGDQTKDGRFEPAEKGEATYLLSDFEIHYPFRAIDHMNGLSGTSERARRKQYCDIPTREEHCEKSWDEAGFSYRWRWATDTYPGDVDCRVRLLSRSGAVVGELEWGLTGMQPQSSVPDVIAVPVDGHPSSAQAACEAGDYEPGEGFEVTYVGSEIYDRASLPENGPPDQRIRLIFEVEDVSEHGADARLCRTELSFESGKVVEGEPFTFTAAPGRFEMDTGHRPSDPITDADVACDTLRSTVSKRA